MEAKTFISKKYDAAVEELKAIEAEYKPRLEAARAAIATSKKWLDELGSQKPMVEPQIPVQTITRTPSERWISARDLTPQAR